MKHYYQNKDPFAGKTNTFLYQDISNTFAPYGMSTEVFFDAIVTREDFLHGTYKLIEVDAAGNIISTVMLDPKIYQEDFAPSGRDIHFNPEQNSKSSFLISNVYGDKQRYLVEVEYRSYGVAFGGKAACLCLHDELLGRISFRQATIFEEYVEDEIYYITEEYEETEIYNESESYIPFPVRTVYKRVAANAVPTFMNVYNGGDKDQAARLWNAQEPNPTHTGYNTVPFYDTRIVQKSRILVKTRQVEKTRPITKTRGVAVESFSHKICNGQYYSPLAYPAFYAKFKHKFGGTLEAPQLPNLLDMFPRNIGTSSNPFSDYFNEDVTGKKINQRIPKIKWMNHLIEDHLHTTAIALAGSISCSGGSGGASSAWGSYTSATYNVILKDNSWNQIEAGINVDLNNYEFADRFEPKCIDVIPFIRMV